jgi:predicted acyl esterase
MLPRALLATLLLAGALVAGCTTPTVTEDAPPVDGAGAERVPVEAWTANLSAPVYREVVSAVHYLAADDGTQLSLTVHLPSGLPADAKVPTLLQITPYQPLSARKSTPLTGTESAGGSWGFFVERGAAYVEADARGTGASGGCLDFGGEADRADARMFVEWVRAQPWSNGVVVTDGVSHPGMGSVVAHAAVPDLAAALAHAPVVSYYRDEWYQGAKFEDQFNGPAYQAIEALPAAYADPRALLAQAAPCFGSTARDFDRPDGRYDALWQERDLSRHAHDARAPILLTQGFVDLNVFPDHVQYYWDALPDDFPKSVIWGWWYHGWPDMEGHPAEDFAMIRHRWLDRALFGLENGLDAEPRVLVEDSTGAWHEGHDWPLEPSERVTLHPTVDGGLASTLGEAGDVSFEDAPGAVRGRWEGASAVFRTEPLVERRLVNGAPVLDLVATSSVDATKWVVWLMDEAPDGSWQRVTHGYADSHTWGPEDRWLPMEAGKTYLWTVRLMPTAVVLEPGHRLALVVASQDSGILADAPESDAPCFDDHRGGCYRPSGIVQSETAGRAVNTVLVGPAATALKLAWVDPELTAKP